VIQVSRHRLEPVECLLKRILKDNSDMSTTADKLATEIRALPDVEKLRLVDAILNDLDKPDPEIDRVWAEEARQRWAAYKAGRMPTVSYEEVMAKHRQR
jgi:putative addiction module component (TIGR02574 family)